MRYFKRIIIGVIVSALSCLHLNSTDLKVKDLFFDDSKPYHLKIIDVIPN